MALHSATKMMISKQLLGQAAYRHQTGRLELLSIFAVTGRGLVYVLRAVLGILQPEQNDWVSIGVQGVLAASFMGGTPATANSDEPISECNRCWSQLFVRHQERLKT
jgi:hypothetical protein